MNKIQYTNATEELFYDRSGNRTKRLYHRVEELYQYDRRNRLTTYIQINHYDAKGLRNEIEENDRLVSFIFRESEIVIEESQEDKIRYIRTNVLFASDAESARMYYHYASDEMSSITHVVDSETGEILNQYEYDVWGNPTVCEEKVSNRFKFNGQQYDLISQQYYLRARYYSPIIGRFTQEDTYRGDGLNLYAYCVNNPVYYVDPSGHDCGNNTKCMTELLETNEIKLSEKEQYAINKYLSSESYSLNDKLRRGEPLSDMEKNWIKDLDSALDKMPEYKGTVYRSTSSFGIEDVDAFIQSHSTEELKTFKSYLSSSTEIYDDSFPIQYVIKSIHGKDIRLYNPGEKEILFQHDTTFLIRKILGNVIYMEEI